MSVSPFLSKSQHSTYLAKELKKDSSRRGKLNALRARASINDWTSKLELYSGVIEGKFKTAAEKKAIIGSLYRPSHSGFEQKFAERFYRDLLVLNKSAPDVFLGRFAQSLSPLNCSQSLNTKMASFLKKPSLKMVAKRKLLKNFDEDQRCLNIRESNKKLKRYAINFR